MKYEIPIEELHVFISEQKATSTGFTKEYDDGYKDFRIGVMLKLARLRVGLSHI